MGLEWEMKEGKENESGLEWSNMIVCPELRHMLSPQLSALEALRIATEARSCTNRIDI